jgi:hypothetical protein
MMLARGWYGPLLSVALATPLLGQVVLEIESRDHRVSPPKSETTFVVTDGRQIALGLTSGSANPEGGMIYRAGRREMVVLNHRDRSYMVLDKAAIQSLAGQMNQAMGQIEESLRNVPPEQQAFMRQMMAGQKPSQGPPRSPAQVRRTADRATVFGYPATRYEILRDGRKEREMYVTDWQNLDGGRDVAAAFVDLGGFAQELAAALPGGNSGPAATMDDNIFTAMNEIDGFPVGVREYRSDGTIEREWALRSAKRQRVDPATFSPPAGYRRQAMVGS